MDEITKELLDALKPFAAFFDAVEHMGGNYPKTGAIYSVTSHIGGHRELSVEDFKQARAAIAKAETALAAPQPSYWILWERGDCPVAHSTIVNVRYRDGWEGGGLASKFRWHHATQESSDAKEVDIIAYRVVKP